jgi:hypothetical protein
MCAVCGCGKKKGQAGYGKGKAGKKTLSPKQKKIAGAVNPKGKITGADFKALKNRKGM